MDNSNFLFGAWWKFNKYEIQNGFIRPMPGATLTAYDPWKMWKSLIESEGTARLSPLRVNPLLAVARELGYHSVDPRHHADPRALSKDQEQLILNWVNVNGLLGLLPHRVEYVRFAPRWWTGPLEISNPETDEHYYIPAVTRPMHKFYARGPRSWKGGRERVRGKRTQSPAVFAQHDASLDGQLVPNDFLDANHRGGLVHIRNLINVEPHLRMRFEPLRETWARFFPCVSEEDHETFQYPRPLSEEFWRMYEEPVDEFLKAAVLLSDSVEVLAGGPHRTRSGLEKLECDQLNALASPIQPEITLGPDGRLTVGWAFPSLLSALAMVTVLQIGEGEGRFVGLCEGCSMPFVTGDQRAKYCGKRCRERVQKRKQRAIAPKSIKGTSKKQ